MITAVTPRIVAAVPCCLLVITAAAAEGAWVLWLSIGATYTPFEAYGGTTGEKECKEAASQPMTDMDKNTKQMGDFLKSGGRYVCLPESVDPRGPKERK